MASQEEQAWGDRGTGVEGYGSGVAGRERDGRDIGVLGS